MRLFRRGLASWIMAGVVVAAGCKLSTEAVALQNFEWQAIERANDVTEGMDAAELGGDVAVLGQLKTPTLCFSLKATFEQSRSTLTLRIAAQQTSSSTCSTTPGGYQYTAAIRGLAAGDYTVRAIHSVPGSADKEYTKAIKVR
jgi:hypothetical protein